MQRALTAVLGAATVALPAANAIAAVNDSAATTVTKKTVVTKKVLGSAAEADRWGTVQVSVTVKKTTVVTNGVKKVTRKWTDIGGTFTYHTDRSLYIMQQSLPQLRHAGAAVAQRQRRHDLRRDVLERRVHAVAPGSARQSCEGLSDARRRPRLEPRRARDGHADHRRRSRRASPTAALSTRSSTGFAGSTRRSARSSPTARSAGSTAASSRSRMRTRMFGPCSPAATSSRGDRRLLRPPRQRVAAARPVGAREGLGRRPRRSHPRRRGCHELRPQRRRRHPRPRRRAATAVVAGRDPASARARPHCRRRRGRGSGGCDLGCLRARRARLRPAHRPAPGRRALRHDHRPRPRDRRCLRDDRVRDGASRQRNGRRRSRATRR